MKKALYLALFSVMMVLAFAACETTETAEETAAAPETTEETTEEAAAAASLTIEGPMEVAVDGTITLTASAYAEDMSSTTANPKWSVDDAEIVKLNETEGDEITVTGLSEGMAYITAEQDGATAQTMVQVSAAE